jgi:SAM-dependent methyltransferase
MPELHQDRRRADSFGDDAERYDRVRPTYPVALVDDLTQGRPLDVVDVGCGTGIASRLFAARGCTVLGVEADDRMADIARRQGTTVEVAPFEGWDLAGRSFDLLICGQAWHWIDPVAGEAQAARCLRPGGRFAAFWNVVQHRPKVTAALERAYGPTAPELIGASVALGDPRRLAERDGREPEFGQLTSSGAFDHPQRRLYEWSRTFDVDEWIDYLATVSDHHVLPAERRRAVLDAVAGELAAIGGSFTVDYRTRLVTAVRV